MKIIPKNKQELINKVKNGISVVLIGASLITVPAITNAAEVNAAQALVKTEQPTYIMEENTYYGIKLDGKTPQELFNNKAKFLLGEDIYNNYYLTNRNISTLKNYFENMYGENTFTTLKEYEIRVSELSESELLKKYANNVLSLQYEQRQLGIFPNSKYKNERQNTIDTLTIENTAIENILINDKDMYNTLYDMNEFTSECIGNALLNEKYTNSKEVFEKYTKDVLDPVVACIDIYQNGIITEFDAIDIGKYPNYNLIKHNPVTYGLMPEIKSYKLR